MPLPQRSAQSLAAPRAVGSSPARCRALTGGMWGTHRQARVALGPWRPHDAGAIQSGAARLALLALGTCLPLVTLRDSVSLGRAAGEPQMAGDPSSRHGEKALPAGWHRSGSGRRGTGLGRQRAGVTRARAARHPSARGAVSLTWRPWGTHVSFFSLLPWELVETCREQKGDAASEASGTPCWGPQPAGRCWGAGTPLPGKAGSAGRLASLKACRDAERAAAGTATSPPACPLRGTTGRGW